jgi:two-component system, OmpR family, sensor histidine kinase TctE
MDYGARWSLARRQMVVLTSSLSVLAILLGLGGAWFIHGFTEQAADRVLSASVSSIVETIALEQGQITLDVPAGAFGMLEDSARDNVYYAVTAGKRLVTGYKGFPAPDPAGLAPDRISYRYATFLDQPVRIATQTRRLPRMAEPVIVQVAETLDERHAKTSSMLLGLAGLEAILILFAAILIRPAVRWGLAPLARLEAEIATREAGPFGYQPLIAERVPRELNGLVQAFNNLLARLDDAAERMRQFTADASHQMRTPLAVLKTHLALVRRQDFAQTESKRALAEVDQAVDRLERLLSQLLGLSRAENEANGLRTAHARFSLTTLAADSARELAPQAVAAGVDIRFEAQDESWVESDSGIVAEIVSNLIDNAIRYNRRGGTVIVRTVAAADHVAVEIEDDGPGIPAEYRDAVFERFFRLDRDQDLRGSGLGLPIVRSLAIACGADVTLSEPATGTGLIARLSFQR